MTHSNAQGALDALFDIIRRQAESDPQFGAELVKALKVPIELSIETPADVSANMLLLDPFVIAGKGLDEFRGTFGKLKDAELKKIVRAYNLAPPEMVTGKGAPKGGALVSLMWEAAKQMRDKMQSRD